MRPTGSAGSINDDNADMAAHPLHAGDDLFGSRTNVRQFKHS